MTKNRLKKRFFSDLVFFEGTDIPPASTHQFLIYTTIGELIGNEQGKELSMDDIFNDFTLNKQQRFEVISGLIKRKFIRRTKINDLVYYYETIPKMTYREGSNMRSYVNLSNQERFSLNKLLIKDVI